MFSPLKNLRRIYFVALLYLLLAAPDLLPSTPVLERSNAPLKASKESNRTLRNNTPVEPNSTVTTNPGGPEDTAAASDSSDFSIDSRADIGPSFFYSTQLRIVCRNVNDFIYGRWQQINVPELSLAGCICTTRLSSPAANVPDATPEDYQRAINLIPESVRQTNPNFRYLGIAGMALGFDGPEPHPVIAPEPQPVVEPAPPPPIVQELNNELGLPPPAPAGDDLPYPMYGPDAIAMRWDPEDPDGGHDPWEDEFEQARADSIARFVNNYLGPGGSGFSGDGGFFLDKSFFGDGGGGSGGSGVFKRDARSEEDSTRSTVSEDATVID
ncbi:hypothetical protein TWF481_005699 [Arthrobotrys musiformis]|uniref:Uncharacterized protein n=1 Tax=Arthrobotrys musiformis TaxID=47236 RepID=A0AAV9WGM2_9PEZI